MFLLVPKEEDGRGGGPESGTKVAELRSGPGSMAVKGLAVSACQSLRARASREATRPGRGRKDSCLTGRSLWESRTRRGLDARRS